MFKNVTYMTGLIESYLSGTMSADERNRFEDQLAKDELLRQEVKLQQLTLAALLHHGRREDNQLAEAMQGLTHDELKVLLDHRRQQRVDVAACACIHTPEDEGEFPFGHGSSGEGEGMIVPLTGEALPPISANLSGEQRLKRWGRWTRVLATAAVVTGVWLGARWYYLHQVKSMNSLKVSDTYIALQEGGEKAMGAARGDNELFMQRHQEMTDTLDVAEAAPELDAVELLMQQALTAMRIGKAEEAIKLLEPLYKDSGYNKEVGVALAMAYIQAKEQDKAMNTLTALSERYNGDREIEHLLEILTD